MSKRAEDSLNWSIVLGITVILAGITGFMIVNRQEFFPNMYEQHAEQEHEPVRHKLQRDSAEVEVEHSQH